MPSSSYLALAGVLAALSLTPAFAPAGDASHTASVEGNHFVVDGKPFQIISGEMHYARIPRAAWADRLHRLHAMGLNTVTTYVFWNVHEPHSGQFEFSGQNDVAEFIRQAQREGLFVILRPGPYVCAEWELGGYPSWLLKDRSLVLRSRDPKLTNYTDRWFAQLGKQLSPLLLQNGGPILATQVENEYGSFGDDHAYMELIHHLLLQHGLAAPILYTADGPSVVRRGSLPELPAVINFGTGDARQSFLEFATIRPDGPRMSGEYWAGWFDHWGDKHQTRSAAAEAEELRWMLSRGYSVSLYMADGGTSFGWMNGANSNGVNYEPDTTSYDYDAPVSEDGSLTPKYRAFRDVILQTTRTTAPEPPPAPPHVAFPIAAPTRSASLWDNLPTPVASSVPLAMEDLDQNYGYILYTTMLAANTSGPLVLSHLHDYAQVYLDHTFVGSLDRREGKSTLDLPPGGNSRELEILVENSGRVNYTAAIRTERKGILGTVSLAGRELGPWQNFSLPFDNATDPSHFQYTDAPCSGPCFFQKQLIANTPADTWLDLSGNGKGFVWLNDRPLGRFWDIGPQWSLWTPASWLSPGSNTVTLFDLRATGQPHLASSEHWLNTSTVPPLNSATGSRP